MPDLEGMTRADVRFAMETARLFVDEWPGSDAMDAWRGWYNVYLQMLADDLEVCPPEYQWEPLTLTC
jgi:hypothetical protein